MTRKWVCTTQNPKLRCKLYFRFESTVPGKFRPFSNRIRPLSESTSNFVCRRIKESDKSILLVLNHSSSECSHSFFQPTLFSFCHPQCVLTAKHCVLQYYPDLSAMNESPKHPNDCREQMNGKWHTTGVFSELYKEWSNYLIRTDIVRHADMCERMLTDHVHCGTTAPLLTIVVMVWTE